MQNVERIATLEQQIRQQEETIESQNIRIKQLEKTIGKLQRYGDMVTGMSWPFRLTLKLFGGMLGIGALHWFVEGIHWVGNWLNAPIRTGH